MLGIDIMLYQILVVIIAILAVLLLFGRYQNKKTSLQTFLLWAVLWIVLGIFTLVPESSSALANFLGIGRGLDLIIIFGLIGAFYLIFRVYLRIEKLDQDVSKLIRLIAIENEEKDENEK
ncbi:hypothetical protein MBCUT_20690 [Methanobrevibacter cuticularis]|uniref:DUF2304 domain-containing protein n=1 Tax=Methanobrevibacter cuticularis TaxID=47311 RepID=A0A166CHV7_9EURY|nr:DUF2304 family protein [Methanobrevibacter cuticularis]KZX14497.1 hypothetical protein MBCUT_20690 [Methanobrevibacter cuticularis]